MTVKPLTQLLLMLVGALALIAVSCSSTTTVTEANRAAAGQAESADDSGVEVEPTEVVEPEPTKEPVALEDIAPGEVSVVLLDAGAEPRTELRLAIAPGCSEVMSLTTIQEIDQVIDGVAEPGAGPLATIMEFESTMEPENGNFRITSTVVGATAGPDTPPFMADEINDQLQSIVGLTTRTTFTDRALQVPGSASIDGAGALGEFESMLDSLSEVQAPLPLEAVGIGARWQTISALELEGLIVYNITENELVSLDGTVVELNVTASQEVNPDTQMDMGFVVGEVTTWDVTASGTTVVDLATINPIETTLVSEGTQGFDFGTAGDLTQEIRIEVSGFSEPVTGCTGASQRP